MSIIKIKQLTS